MWTLRVRLDHVVARSREFLGKTSNSSVAVFALGSSVGLIYFLSIFGFSIINPMNTEWILTSGGDLAQHYLGWAFFRESEWGFPIGMIKDLAYPFGIPLTFMDAIPILAVLLKPFSPLFPESFQYLGLFTALSFTLQGGISALIFRRFTSNVVVVTICVVFFVVSPVLMMRALAHTALTAQWIILLGIYLILRFKNSNPSHLLFAVSWCLLLTVGVLIHPYFFPMSLVLFSVSVIQTFKAESTRTLLLRIVSPVVVALLIFAGFGGFMRAGNTLSPLDLDIYSLNLVSPVDPMGYSSILSHYSFRDTRDGIPETGEKTGYFGLGLLLLIPVIFYDQLHVVAKFNKQTFLRRVRRYLTLKNSLISFLFLFLFLFSLGSHIKLGSYVLLEWPLPGKIEDIWLMFRSSARMFWPIYYLTMLAVLVYIINLFKGKNQYLLPLFLLPFLAVQLIDIRLSPDVRGKKDFAHKAVNAPRLEESIGVIAAKNEVFCEKKHIISLSPYLYLEEFVDFSRLATDCDMTMSEGYYAHHYKQEEIRTYIDTQEVLFLSVGKESDPNLYTTTDQSEASKFGDNYLVQKINNWYVIAQK